MLYREPRLSVSRSGLVNQWQIPLSGPPTFTLEDISHLQKVSVSAPVSSITL